MQETQETRVQSLGTEDPLEEEMATHLIVCLENPMDRGAWWAAVQWGHKESDRAEQLSTHIHLSTGPRLQLLSLGPIYLLPQTYFQVR